MEARLPGSEAYDRLMGVNSFHPGGVYEATSTRPRCITTSCRGPDRCASATRSASSRRGRGSIPPPGLKHYTKNIGEDLLAYLFFGGNPHDPNAGIHEPPKE